MYGRALAMAWRRCSVTPQAKRSTLQEAANMAIYFRLLDDLEKWLKEVETALATDDVGKDLVSVQVRPRRHPCRRGRACACRHAPDQRARGGPRR